MAAAKKYRIKVRVKVRQRILKHTGRALSVVSAAVILGYSGFLGFRALSSLSPGRFFSFTFKSLSVKSPSEAISAEISRRMARKLGTGFSSADAAGLAAGLRESYPALSRVKVKRSLFGGRVSVEAESEAVVARVLLNGGGAFYLAENGRLLPEHYGPEPAELFDIDVRAGSGDALAPLASFLSELRAHAADFSSRPVRLEYPASGEAPSGASKGAARTCRLVLENDASVLWGDFDFTRAKISRLNEALADAARRLRGPLKVDLRYFRDGKVFVSKLTDI